MKMCSRCFIINKCGKILEPPYSFVKKKKNVQQTAILDFDTCRMDSLGSLPFWSEDQVGIPVIPETCPPCYGFMNVCILILIGAIFLLVEMEVG